MMFLIEFTAGLVLFSPAAAFFAWKKKAGNGALKTSVVCRVDARKRCILHFCESIGESFSLELFNIIFLNRIMKCMRWKS